MANKSRGEMEVKLAGKKYKLKATFEAICEIEDRLDKGLPELAQRLNVRKVMGVKEMGAILHAGIRAGGNDDLSFEAVGALVMKNGVKGLAIPAYQYLAELLFSGQEESEDVSASKKEEAAQPE